MRIRYPNLDDIPEGQISSYAIMNTSVADEKRVFFDNKPDGVYSILGYLNEAAITLTATDETACNDAGDDWLENKICSFLRRSQGFEDFEDFEADAHESKMRYLGENYKINKYDIDPRPRQI